MSACVVCGTYTSHRRCWPTNPKYQDSSTGINAYHIIFIGLKCDSTTTSVSWCCPQGEKRCRSLGVKTWVKAGSSVVLPCTVSCWAYPVLRCPLGLCLWMGLLPFFLPFHRHLRWTILQSLRYCDPTKTNANQKLLQSDFHPVLRQNLMKPQVCMRWGDCTSLSWEQSGAISSCKSGKELQHLELL